MRPREVDVCTDQLEALGIDLIEPVTDLEEFGHRVLLLADPENNVIDVYADI